MIRYIKSFILQDIFDKVILISGPKQSGKNTLSKSLITGSLYFNHDLSQDREKLLRFQWPKDVSALIFDEIHKMNEWIKGYDDSYGMPPSIIVTGSAQLDAFTHVGDSLAGRYFHYRLHPIDIKEAVMYAQKSRKEAYDLLISVGGFPEPFFHAVLNAFT